MLRTLRFLPPACLLLASAALPAAAQGGKPGGQTKVTAVTGIAVSAGTPGPTVTWQAVSGAVSYSVERFLAGAPATYLNRSGPLSTTWWADAAPPASGTYTYRVTANLNKGAVAGEVNFIWTAPATLSSFGVSAASVTGGQSLNAQVTLSGPASSGGFTVQLMTNAPAFAAVPASVTVPQGATSTTLLVATSPVTQSVTVTLSATAGGVTRTAAFTVMAAASGAPALAIMPTSYSFGNVSVGTASPEASLTVTNSGTGPAGAMTVQLTGISAGHFAITANSCASGVAVGASCAVRVSFRPVTAGNHTATLTLWSSTALTVTLTGAGL